MEKKRISANKLYICKDININKSKLMHFV